LGQFGVNQVVALLQRIGIRATKTSDGWYYPYSNSAQTVVDAFSSALQRAGVTLRLSSQVSAMARADGKFILKIASASEAAQEPFERVILAAGGKAYPNLGSTGELFPILKQLGHTVIPKRPALAPLLVDLQEFQTLQGVRLDVGTRLWHGDQLRAQAGGNMIFTEWGLNGPAVMDVSQAVTDDLAGRLTLGLDFLRFFKTEFYAHLEKKRSSDMPVKVFLAAFFPPKVPQLFLSLLHIPETLPLRQLDEAALQELLGRLGDTRLLVKGVRGFEYCQVSAGGVPVSEVTPTTLESRLVKGLHLVGETVDVVGPCGGYNLHYAFASGALAGRAVAQGH
jgi:predicted Rossmann fold flavoprotein